MTISELIKALNEKASEVGPDAEVRIERVYDYRSNDSLGATFGLAVGSRTERAFGYPADCLNSADRVKEMDRYIDFGYMGG